MEITTKIFLSESDVRKIIHEHLSAKGFALLEELDIVVQSKKDIPEGATAGDIIGIHAKVNQLSQS
jgi:hypothetical protein